eukprot:12921087-Alexandrium_andersonii.AAC.1
MGLLEIAPELSREKPAQDYTNPKADANINALGGNPTGGSRSRAPPGPVSYTHLTLPTICSV